MDPLELYGTKRCPYTEELREELRWQGRDFEEHDVEDDPAALRRMLNLTGGDRTVPVLVEGDEVVQTGWKGRGCIVAPPDNANPA